MSITENPTYIPTEAAKRLKRFIRAHDRWAMKCARLNALRGHEGTPEFREAFASWEKGRPPSKASKYHAYDEGNALRRYLGLGDEARPSTVEDLRNLLATFTAQSAT